MLIREICCCICQRQNGLRVWKSRHLKRSKEEFRLENSKTVPESVLICPFNIWNMRCVVASQRIESAAERVNQSNDVSTERASRGNERTACGHGGLPLRRVLRGDGAQVREAARKRRRVGASHLRVRRVRPQSNVQRGRRQQLIGDKHRWRSLDWSISGSRSLRRAP